MNPLTINTEEVDSLVYLNQDSNYNRILNLNQGVLLLNRPKNLQKDQHKQNKSIKQYQDNGQDKKNNHMQQTINMNFKDSQYNNDKAMNSKMKSECYADNSLNLVEIYLNSCDVNVFALKKLIAQSLDILSVLKIINCRFYLEDQNTRDKKNQCSNNEMLNTLNISSLICSLQLKFIQDIQIILHEEIANQRQTTYNHEINCEQIKQNDDQGELKKQLMEIYSCDENSEFINYELNIKPQIEMKYDTIEKQEQQLNYVLKGNQNFQSDKQNLQILFSEINKDIITDIYESLYFYNKYIKKTHKDNILVISQDCLEKNKSFDMIKQVIRLNKKKITTVIFKETGTIPIIKFKNICKVIQKLYMIDSLAFFTSQLRFESYQDLCKLIQNKNIKFIVLNRSSFNYNYYLNLSVNNSNSYYVNEPLIKHNLKQQQQQQLQQKSHGNIQDIQFDENYYDYDQNIDFILNQNYYGFFLIQFGEYEERDILYEFCPYEQLLYERDCMEKNDYYLQGVEETLKQELSYPKAVKLEIKKYKNLNACLINTGIAEKLTAKYIKLLKQEKYKFDQIELEEDIKIMIKYINIYNTKMIDKMIKQLTNLFVQSSLHKQFYCQQHQYIIQHSKYCDPYNTFLIESKLRFRNHIQYTRHASDNNENDSLFIDINYLDPVFNNIYQETPQYNDNVKLTGIKSSLSLFQTPSLIPKTTQKQERQTLSLNKSPFYYYQNGLRIESPNQQLLSPNQGNDMYFSSIKKNLNQNEKDIKIQERFSKSNDQLVDSERQIVNGNNLVSGQNINIQDSKIDENLKIRGLNLENNMNSQEKFSLTNSRSLSKQQKQLTSEQQELIQLIESNKRIKVQFNEDKLYVYEIMNKQEDRYVYSMMNVKYFRRKNGKLSQKDENDNNLLFSNLFARKGTMKNLTFHYINFSIPIILLQLNILTKFNVSIQHLILDQLIQNEEHARSLNISLENINIRKLQIQNCSIFQMTVLQLAKNSESLNIKDCEILGRFHKIHLSSLKKLRYKHSSKQFFFQLLQNILYPNLLNFIEVCFQKPLSPSQINMIYKIKEPKIYQCDEENKTFYFQYDDKERDIQYIIDQLRLLNQIFTETNKNIQIEDLNYLNRNYSNNLIFLTEIIESDQLGNNIIQNYSQLKKYHKNNQDKVDKRISEHFDLSNFELDMMDESSVFDNKIENNVVNVHYYKRVLKNILKNNQIDMLFQFFPGCYKSHNELELKQFMNECCSQCYSQNNNLQLQNTSIKLDFQKQNRHTKSLMIESDIFKQEEIQNKRKSNQIIIGKSEQYISDAILFNENQKLGQDFFENSKRSSLVSGMINQNKRRDQQKQSDNQHSKLNNKDQFENNINQQNIQHDKNLCFLRTCQMKSMFNPKKIEIRFCQNIYFKEKRQQNKQILENLNILDISYNTISDEMQVELINFLIQNSPNLKQLIARQVSCKLNKQMQFNSPKVNLQALNFSENYIEDITALSEIVKSVNSLVKVNFQHCKSKIPVCDSIDEIIKRNQTTLEVIKTDLYVNSITSCILLKKLFLNFPQTFAIQFHESVFSLDLQHLSIHSYHFNAQFNTILSLIQNNNFQKLSLIENFYLSQDTLMDQQNNFSHSQNYVPDSFESLFKDNKNQQQQENPSYRQLNQSELENNNNNNNNNFFTQDGLVRKKEYVRKRENTDYFQVLYIQSSFDFWMKTFQADKYLNSYIQLNENINLMHNLVILHVTDDRILASLNQIFGLSANTLKVLDFSYYNLQKDSNQFDKVNFSLLPRTVQELNFSHIKHLKSLKFLYPFIKRNMSYKIKKLNVTQTKVSIIEIIELVFEVEEIIYESINICQIKGYLNSIKQQKLNNNIYMIFACILVKMILPSNDHFHISEKQLFFKTFFQEKIPNLLDHKYPLILSPKQICHSPINFASLFSNYDLFKQIINGRQITVPQLLASTLLLNKSYNNNILGYTRIKPFSNRFFYYQLVSNTFSLSQNIYQLPQKQINSHNQLLSTTIQSLNNENQSIERNNQKESFSIKPFQLESKQQEINPNQIQVNTKYNQEKYLQEIQQQNSQAHEEKRKTEELREEKLRLNYYLQLSEVKKIGNQKNIYLPQYLMIDYNILKEQNFSELSFIDILSEMPPTDILIKDMSIQFIKIWYTMNWNLPFWTRSDIYFEKNNIYNTSFIDYLNKQLKKSLNAKRKKITSFNLKYLFLWIFQRFLGALKLSEPIQYKYDWCVVELTERINDFKQMGLKILLACYLPFAIFFQLFLILYFSSDSNSNNFPSVSSYSYLFHLIFIILYFIIEFIIFRFILLYIAHLLPKHLINSIKTKKNKFKSFLLNIHWTTPWFAAFLKQFTLSQLLRFNSFANFIFLYLTYKHENYGVFTFSFISVLIMFLYQIYQIYQTVIRSNKNQKKTILTDSLAIFNKICNILEFYAVSDILDIITPSNICMIRGRMFYSRTIYIGFKIIVETLPITLYQIINFLTIDSINNEFTIPLVFTILTLLIQLYNFLTISPSTLDQEDFNKQHQKKLFKEYEYNKRLSNYENDIFTLRFFEHIKQIRLKQIQSTKSIGHDDNSNNSNSNTTLPLNNNHSYYNQILKLIFQSNYNNSLNTNHIDKNIINLNNNINSDSLIDHQINKNKNNNIQIFQL